MFSVPYKLGLRLTTRPSAPPPMIARRPVRRRARRIGWRRRRGRRSRRPGRRRRRRRGLVCARFPAAAAAAARWRRRCLAVVDRLLWYPRRTPWRPPAARRSVRRRAALAGARRDAGRRGARPRVGAVQGEATAPVREPAIATLNGRLFCAGGSVYPRRPDDLSDDESWYAGNEPQLPSPQCRTIEAQLKRSYVITTVLYQNCPASRRDGEPSTRPAFSYLNLASRRRGPQFRRTPRNSQAQKVSLLVSYRPLAIWVPRT